MVVMPSCQMVIIISISTSPSPIVHQKLISERPLVITIYDRAVCNGITAPPTHSIFIRFAAGSHLSVMVTEINSVDTKPKPSNRGNERKAVKRISFLRALSCLPGSSRRLTSMGCVTW